MLAILYTGVLCSGKRNGLMALLCVIKHAYAMMKMGRIEDLKGTVLSFFCPPVNVAETVCYVNKYQSCIIMI